jgi:hypothetical protein
MGRTWTDEQKKAFGEKMKKARLEKTPKQEAQVTIPESQLNELLERMAKLEAQKQEQISYAQNEPQRASISSTGQVIGIQEKYPINKALYLHLDPRDRLFKEPQLKRFALRDNYSLYWDIFVSTYTTSSGVKMSEPRFELQIRQKEFDEDGNETGEYHIGKHVSHEDYDAAVELALSLGMDVDPKMGVEFLDEMRYQSWKMFISELFYPPKTIKLTNTGKKEMVVDGRVVTFYENPKDLNRDK